MEYEQQKQSPTLRELLGSTRKPGETEIGIINETEQWIQRRALDYLMIGFMTDDDKNEAIKEQRYEAYLNNIEADLALYREDVKRWDSDQLQNATPGLWQIGHDFKTDTYTRRPDLPPIEVCLGSIVGPLARRIPTRDEIKHVSYEGLHRYYEEALVASQALLAERLDFIRTELPIAPPEFIEVGVMTQPELMAEQEKLTSRLRAIDEMILDLSDTKNATPVRSDDESVLENLDFKHTVEQPHTMTDELREVVRSLRRMGGLIIQLMDTGQK